ncbi:MAG: hypothetical protein HOO96_29030 [Polyangiaceae bacterium]|nr:hypothetical protein [Polyangiaceae bacterium]
MKRLIAGSLVSVLFAASAALGGCAANPSEEDTSQSSDGLTLVRASEGSFKRTGVKNWQVGDLGSNAAFVRGLDETGRERGSMQVTVERDARGTVLGVILRVTGAQAAEVRLDQGGAVVGGHASAGAAEYAQSVADDLKQTGSLKAMSVTVPGALRPQMSCGAAAAGAWFFCSAAIIASVATAGAGAPTAVGVCATGWYLAKEACDRDLPDSTEQ